MAITSFNPENRTYRDLLGNGRTYRVPCFQRDYSWGEAEWTELWSDICNTLPVNGEPDHYMGYLLLQTDNVQDYYEVIDGQQRITTISLIVLAAMRLLKNLADAGEEAAGQRLDQLRSTYIGYLDPVTLIPDNKLSLNRNNDNYYKEYLVTLTPTLPSRGFSTSTNALRKGFEWFEKKLEEHIKNEADTGKALAHFVEIMSRKLFFTVITVSDQLNAYKVFETLNARGVHLSTTDLLKNYLFSVLAKSNNKLREMEELEDRWNNMVDRLGDDDFPTFLRTYWNGRNPFVRQTELFKAVRKQIQSREAVFALLREMTEDIESYLALTQPEGSEWPQDWKQSVQELRMFSVTQPYTMLMAAKRKLSAADFADLLRATVVISFRYNVIGAQNPNEQERTYHSAAMALHRGEVSTFVQVLPFLRPIYPTDALFRSHFSEKSIKASKSGRGAKIVRYILSKLEKQESRMVLDAASYTIEHVLPKSPEAGWDAFNERDFETFVHRLANMVLLEKKPNQDIGNMCYADKRPILQKSTVPLTQKLAANYDDWTPEQLSARQQQLARIATSVWRIDQLA